MSLRGARWRPSNPESSAWTSGLLRGPNSAARNDELPCRQRVSGCGDEEAGHAKWYCACRRPVAEHPPTSPNSVITPTQELPVGDRVVRCVGGCDRGTNV